MRIVLFLLALLPLPGLAQERVETQEMAGHLGSRSALLYLHNRQRTDGSWHMTGEYIVLPTLARRFLEGERGPQLGITTLKEGTTPILFGRPATGEMRGTLRDGVFRGTRYGPGGQERERFEFSDAFPAMDGYSAAVRCEAGDGRYTSSLDYAVEGGKLKSFEWRSSIGPGGHPCAVTAEAQEAAKGALKFTSGRCSVTLRELGEFVKVAAENCAQRCGSEGYLETVLVDRRGNCRLLRPEPR